MRPCDICAVDKYIITILSLSAQYPLSQKRKTHLPPTPPLPPETLAIQASQSRDYSSYVPNICVFFQVFCTATLGSLRSAKQSDATAEGVG